MITFLSLVTSVKDYVEIVHKLIESDSSFKINNYDEFGPLITYVLISLQELFRNFITLKWFNNLWDLPIIIPDISSAMVSEISILDGYFHNAFNFLDKPLSYGETNLIFYNLEKFSIGVINSLFLFIPTGTSHLITIRRFVMQGLEAGYLAGLGSIFGNVFWISSVIFGFRFFVIPWLSLDIFRYLLGFVLLVKYMWDSYSEKKMLVTTEPAKQKIFLLNFLIALTEQTRIYPFITNLSIGSESSILESFPAQNLENFVTIHCSYILGLTLGCLSLLHLTCWFWENPAFKIYMWLISSFKVSTSLYYKILNFTFLYLTMIFAISSIPYYGLDYTLTNPLGLVQDDRILYQSETLMNAPHLSFLGTKASDRNTRRNRGRHGRRERWKRRIRKYRTFDASLYDQGIYDLFTMEDLNYGFDRFWLRRKMRNHRVRFRFFPGSWMRSFKKQLAKPRLESYAGPRQEFFRILFEQVYHPSFHVYPTSSKRGGVRAKMNLGAPQEGKQEYIASQKQNFNDLTSASKLGFKTTKDWEAPPSFLFKNDSIVHSKSKVSIYSNNPSTNQDSSIIKENLKVENSTLRKFVRKMDIRIKTSEITKNFKKSNLNFEASSAPGQTPLYSKRWKQIFSKISHSNLTNENLLTNNKAVLSNFYANSLANKVFQDGGFAGEKTWPPSLTKQRLKDENQLSRIERIGAFASKMRSKQPLTPLWRVRTIKKQNSQINISNQEQQVLKYRSIYFNKDDGFLSLIAKGKKQTRLPQPPKGGGPLSLQGEGVSHSKKFPKGSKSCPQSREILTPLNCLGPLQGSQGGSAQNSQSSLMGDEGISQMTTPFTLSHPLKFYQKKQQAFEKKLHYYTPTIFRKFSIENNAPYFRVMMKRYFYYYKPTLRWERTMKVASLRKARRKTPTSPKKMQFPDNIKNIDLNNFGSPPHPLLTRLPFGLQSKEEKRAPSCYARARHRGCFVPVPPKGDGLLRNGRRARENQRAIPTHNYTIVGKRASRYRYQIYKDVLQHWYYTPFNRLLLKFDVDLFIKRQPNSHFLTKNEENLLHLRRFLLAEHYNTLRWYTQMEHYRSMKTKIGGTKSFGSGAYNQQFSGTFKKIRHLFAITPSQTNQTVLKFDQPLYNEYLNNSTTNPLHSKGQQNLQIHEELLPWVYFPCVANPLCFVPLQSKGGSRREARALLPLVSPLRFSSLAENQRVKPPLEFNQSKSFGGALLPLAQSGPSRVSLANPPSGGVRRFENQRAALRQGSFVKEGAISKQSPFKIRRAEIGFATDSGGIATLQGGGMGVNEKNYLLGKDLLNQSTQIIRDYLKKTNPIKQKYIKNLLEQKNYVELTNFLYKGKKTRGLKPVTNYSDLLTQEKDYLLTNQNVKNPKEFEKLSLDYYLRSVFPTDLWIHLLKKWKRKINDQEFLKNFLQRRVEKREKRKLKKEKNIQSKLQRLETTGFLTPSSTETQNLETKNFNWKASSELLKSGEPKSKLTTGVQKALKDGLLTFNNEQLQEVNQSILRKIDKNPFERLRNNIQQISRIPSLKDLKYQLFLKKENELSISLNQLSKILKQAKEQKTRLKNLRNLWRTSSTWAAKPGRANPLLFPSPTVEGRKSKHRSLKMASLIPTKFKNIYTNYKSKSHKFLKTKIYKIFLKDQTRQRNFKNWQAKERTLNKQKRIRKEFKSLSKNPFKYDSKNFSKYLDQKSDIPLTVVYEPGSNLLQSTESSNFSKKSNFSSTQVKILRNSILTLAPGQDQNVRSKNGENATNITLGFARKKLDSATPSPLSEAKQSEVLPLLATQGQNQKLLGPPFALQGEGGIFEKAGFRGPSDPLSRLQNQGPKTPFVSKDKAAQPWEALRLTNFSWHKILKNTYSKYLSKKFKRKKSPQRRVRIRKNRAVIKKRTLNDSLKRKNLRRSNQNLEMNKTELTVFSLTGKPGRVSQLNNQIFKPYPLQRRAKQKKQRFWKQKRGKYSQKLRKYRKRRRSVLGKIRILNKQLKRIKITNDLKNWWWKNFLPNLRATTDSLWQYEKERQIQQKLFELSVSEILERDKLSYQFTSNSQEINSLQIGDFDYKPLAIPEALRLRNANPKNINGNFSGLQASDLDNKLKNRFAENLSPLNPLRSKGLHKTDRISHVAESYLSAASGSNPKKIKNDISQKGVSLSELNSSAQEKFISCPLAFTRCKGQAATNQGMLHLNKISQETNETVLTSSIPFYAGWDDSLRKFVVTNRLLSRRESGYEMRFQDPPNIFGPPFPLRTPFVAKQREGTKQRGRGPKQSPRQRSQDNATEVILKNTKSSADSPRDNRVVLTPKREKHPMLGRVSGQGVETPFPSPFFNPPKGGVGGANRGFFLQSQGEQSKTPSDFAVQETDSKANIETNNRIDKFENFAVQAGRNILSFTATPLKGMNTATTLYWQIPFTTYDPDQFFALGMDGFAPLGWRRFQFRHSILKSWLYAKGTPLSEAAVKSLGHEVLALRPLSLPPIPPLLATQGQSKGEGERSNFLRPQRGTKQREWGTGRANNYIVKNKTNNGLQSQFPLLSPIPSHSLAKQRERGQSKGVALLALQGEQEQNNLSGTVFSNRRASQIENNRVGPHSSNLVYKLKEKNSIAAKYDSQSSIFNKNTRNIYRRLKKRYRRVKKHPRSPVWFPSGPLLNQVLPVHYIYIFYKRSRLPRDRYIKRRLIKSKTQTNLAEAPRSVNSLTNSVLGSSFQRTMQIPDFTLRKRVKTKRKYHIKQDLTKQLTLIPRRVKFIGPYLSFDLQTKGNGGASDSINMRWRPLSRQTLNRGISQSIADLIKEKRVLRSKQRKKEHQELNRKQPANLRIKQLRRRVQRQIIRSVWRYKPRAGGFVWPGDYLKLELVKAPKLDPKINSGILATFESTFNSEGTNKLRSSPIKVKRKKKRSLQEWQIQPKKYLLQKHNYKVIKKKLEKANRLNKMQERTKELTFSLFSA